MEMPTYSLRFHLNAFLPQQEETFQQVGREKQYFVVLEKYTIKFNSVKAGDVCSRMINVLDIDYA